MKAIIISGVSRGLGKSLFDKLYENNTLFCLSRKFNEYQVAIADKSEGRVKLIHCDLSDVDALSESLGALEGLPEFDEIVFINNAGLIKPISRIGELNETELSASIAVNFTSPIIITNKILSCIDVSKKKVIVINISSGAAKYPFAGWALYCSTKAGSKMFFDVLEKQYETSTSFEVIQIDPGVIDTRMQEEIRESNREEFPRLDEFKSLREENKLRTPEEVAEEIITNYIETMI